MKDFKSFTFLKNSSLENQELLKSPKVEELLFHQWENYHKIKDIAPVPDFRSIFKKIDKKNTSVKGVHLEPTLLHNTTKTSLIPNHNQGSYFSLNRFLSIAVILAVLMLGGGYIAYLSGINIFDRTQTMIFAAAKGQRAVCTLPDGTKVWLNSDSKLEYPKIFAKNIRRVKLSGEAYFDVVKNPKQPFIVETSLVSIKVLGTKFNVKSYPFEKTIETILESGSISLEKINAKSKINPLIIKPQQKATYNIDRQNFKLESVNSELLTSWKEGKLIFDNELINDVILKIERHYGLKVNITNCRQDDRITLTVKDETIDEVMRLIQLTTPLNFSVENFDGIKIRTLKNRNE